MTQPSEPPAAGNIEEWLRWAETKIALSLAVSLYFKPPPAPVAEGLLECYRQFLDLCEPRLRWYGSETSGRYREADPKVLRIPFRRVPEAMDHGKSWYWCAMGGEHHRHASPCQFEAYLTNDRENLSFFRAAFPVEMFAADFGGFAALVKSFAARVPFFFGYGGFSLSNSLEVSTRQSNEQHLAPVAMRFSGIQVEQHSATRLCCKEAIKGVDWLTLIGSSFVEKLGGRAALRARLSEAIDLDDLPAGLMIRAGTAPGLGDVNAGERLPLYREVHRALTPVRNLSHWPLGDRAFWEPETRRWMSRFDD